MLKKIFLILLVFISLLFLATTLKLNRNDKSNTKNIFHKLAFTNNLEVNISEANKLEKEKEEKEIAGKIIIEKLQIDNVL